MRRDAFCSTGLGQLSLVEVGLKSSFENVKWSGQDTSCHASYAVILSAGNSCSKVRCINHYATYPPATKCAHDFATGLGFFAIAVA